GFTNQPYMRGYSPKSVTTLIADAYEGDFLGQLSELWKHKSSDCGNCINSPTFYVSSIRDRPDWRLWVDKVSKAVRNADAILVPFVLYAHETRYVDRGILVAKRSLGVSLFLISTSDA